MIYVTSVGPGSAWKSSCGSYRKVTLYLCLYMITESLCTIVQRPKFPCRMSAPLPLHDVLPRQCTFFPLPQACCFILGHFIWCLPTSAPYCKSIPFTLSMLVYTIYHLTSPSHMVSPFNLSLCRRCSMSHNSVLLPFTRSSSILWDGALGAMYVQSRCGVPGVWATAWYYFLSQSRCLPYLPSHFWL